MSDRAFSLNLGGRLMVYDRPVVMGILNVTPDSFYAGSRAIDDDSLARRVELMIREGADMIDVGGYSTRPGAADVDEKEEILRLRLGIEAIRDVDTNIPVSVDTFRAHVAQLAVEEMGANIINDVSGGNLDHRMFETVAQLRVPYILMHSRGTAATMQQMTDYKDVTADVIHELALKVRELSLLGVADVIIDPGFGFAKTLDQNYELMHNLPVISAAFPGRPLLVGISRKSMLTRLLDISPDDALDATVALDAMALTLGAQILRVHDVKAAVQTVKIYDKLKI